MSSEDRLTQVVKDFNKNTRDHRRIIKNLIWILRVYKVDKRANRMYVI